ncbi:hypothetical protein AHMF7605_21690 [Adhaeribacter arboris]|uniref:ArnR1-like winged helix-turn-helix domain-containing protein n=2 Tax=Adhaeribacter arboris TaxID=2072846 RepID=A0A2T2YK85_9BACT|nr:hypothetical protein AHMF7605_21690 [Adhaeribacter arboris]
MLEIPAEFPLEEVKKEILQFCVQAKSRNAILEYILVDDSTSNFRRYIGQLLKQRLLKNNINDKPYSRQEQFIITQKGLNYLKAIAY